MHVGSGINMSVCHAQTKDSRRPILLTSRGRGVAVVQSLEEYENLEEERDFMKAVAQSLMEVKEGNEQDLKQVKKKLGIKT